MKHVLLLILLVLNIILTGMILYRLRSKESFEEDFVCNCQGSNFDVPDDYSKRVGCGDDLECACKKYGNCSLVAKKINYITPTQQEKALIQQQGNLRELQMANPQANIPFEPTIKIPVFGK